ncbi:LamG-like jellyroll fold domain-containing protein [Streptomyces sp. NPDC048438]|uniref:LamG-like jellyroll fold domain-containing protein n=1 Tax=Streptomyces sp. NPDC048438 TaxID=3365551 RepID=UPI003718EC5A
MSVLVEAGWGGLVQAPWSITWTDITSRVDMVQGVTVSRGASDELSETQPGTATLTLDNSDGALTPGNPNSPYYPFVRRNAPIRISALHYPVRTGAAPYPLEQLTGDFDDGAPDPALWTASGGSAEVGGRLRQPVVSGVTARYTSSRSWTLAGSQSTVRLATLPAAGGSSSMSVSWYLNSLTVGTRVRWQYNGLTNTLRAAIEVGGSDAGGVNLTYSPIDHAWLRVRETSGVLIMETSPDGWDWTVRRSAATPAWVGTDQVQMDFAATRTGGTPDYIEWDYLGAQIRPRFYGMVNEWPIEWEGLHSKVTISATDLFKRLNRLPELRSMLGMEVMTIDSTTGFYSFPAAYFPLSEPSGSTSAGSVAGSGIGSLVTTQVGAGGALEFGSEGVPETGETAPTFTPASTSAGPYLVGDLGPQFAADSATWLEHIQVWIKTSTVSRAIVGMHDPTLDYQLVLALNASGVLTVESTQDGSPLTVTTTASGNLANDTWHHIVYDGSAKRVYVDGAAVGGTLLAYSTQDVRTLYVGGYRGARLFSGQIAHLSLHLATGPVGSVYAPISDARTGFSGESADWRVERLARYAGLPSVTLFGSTHDPIASQGPAGSSVVARLREVESTESGRLYAERDYFGLAYQSRDLRYNPSADAEIFTIAYADLEPGTQLADDDQKLCNEVEASRPGGATQLVNAPSSILAFGTYPQQLSILKTSDLSVTDAAYWLVSRYANPQPELREVPIEAFTMPEYLSILDADISSYFTVYDLPSQSIAAELRVTVEGYTETLKEKSHLIQFRTSASSTDSVWILGDPMYSQLDYTTRLAY